MNKRSLWVLIFLTVIGFIPDLAHCNRHWICRGRAGGMIQCHKFGQFKAADCCTKCAAAKACHSCCVNIGRNATDIRDCRMSCPPVPDPRWIPPILQY